jgi:hypothetical protein
MLETFTSQTFAPHIGERFVINVETLPPLELELVSVTEVGTVPSGQSIKDMDDHKGRKPFSLLFRGRREIYMAQHIYPLEHEKFGTLEIFLVPMGPDQQGMLYEAIFA